MRILMLAARPEVHGPLPKLIPHLVSALRDLDCEVTLQPWGRRRERESVWARMTQRLMDIRRAGRVLRERACDVVIVQTAHNWTGLARDIPLLLATRGLRCSVVLQFHGSLGEHLVAPGRRAFKLASALLLRLSDAALVLSSEEQRQWQRFYPHGRFRVVRNPFLPPLPLDPAPARSELCISGRDPIVLFVGRLIELKGILDLVAVLAQGLSRAPFHLLVVGEGPLEREVRERAALAGVSEQLTLTGYLQGEALQAAYQLADVFALPSRREGFPHVILEAMAAGLPVVTTGLRGMADHLCDGVNALFVPPRQPAALAAALTRLLSDRELCARMSEANREKIREFAPDRVGRQYLSTLREVVATRRRGAEARRPQ